jgi:hypothetical protein
MLRIYSRKGILLKYLTMYKGEVIESLSNPKMDSIIRSDIK